MWTLWSTFALAAVHEVELNVVAPREPTSSGWSPLGFVAHRITSVRGSDERANVVIDDGYLQVSCAVNAGALWLHLNWTAPRSWTGRMPEQVECRVGRHRIRATLRQLPPRYLDPSELRAGPDRRAELRLYANDAPAFQWFGLPSETEWAEGTFPWMPEEEDVPQFVGCTVGPGNRLELRATLAAVSRRGACLLQDATGREVQVPIDVVICGTPDEVAGTTTAACPSP
ncbi:MAG: hypothetical protein AAF211_23775 [Myxococcota bacterium]